VYFVPFSDASSTYDGVTARFDTRGGFSDPTSWSFFDIANVRADAVGFTGAAFDGRYVYYVPRATVATAQTGHGLVVRHDTLGDFGHASSWSLFDTQSLGVSAAGFAGGVFDGRFVYLVPFLHSAVARFDARTPPVAMPLSGGSFL
jgi:hypothetical protein